MRFLVLVLITFICCDARYVPENGVYSVVDEMPEYEKGMKSFQQYIDSSVHHLNTSRSGEVFVSFVVEKNGQIKDLKIVKNLSPAQDSIALSIIREAPAKWTPGLYDGKPVEVKMTYPIKFK